jgi:DNA invertase Pin-like site-specific DNA recombinase
VVRPHLLGQADGQKRHTQFANSVRHVTWQQRWIQWRRHVDDVDNYDILSSGRPPEEPAVKSKPATIAYSYLRFSQPSQSEGDSQRRQNELRDAWLKRNPDVKLDASETLEDKGVSGFRGEHRDNPDRHALAKFIERVKEGRIPRGSYLIVESLDRLSREDIIPALSLLLDLIQRDIRVVQLLPAETTFDKSSNPMHLMMAIMELSRGHSESRMKSERVGRAWADKKRRAAATGEPVTARALAWLRLVDGKWVVVPGVAEAIRRIYRLAIDGHGLSEITKRLNAEGVPPVGNGRTAPFWARSYVHKILKSRAAMGEFQPCKGRRKKKEPDGPPIANYYPAIVTEEEWYAARAALQSRRGKAGRPPKFYINLFGGLLRDARDGGTIHQHAKTDNYALQLVPYRALQGVTGSQPVQFPAAVFEREILKHLREIDPREILPSNGHEEKVLVLTGKLAEVEAQIEKVKTRLERNYSEAVADVLDRHAARRKKLAEELAQARQEASSPLGAAWGDCGSLLAVLEATPAAEVQDVRVKLRGVLRRVVESIWCLFVQRDAGEAGVTVKLAAVQIWFAGGARRDYFIAYRQGKRGFGTKRPEQAWSRSLAEVTPAALDLRKRSDARALDRALAAVDWDES